MRWEVSTDCASRHSFASKPGKGRRDTFGVRGCSPVQLSIPSPALKLYQTALSSASRPSRQAQPISRLHLLPRKRSISLGHLFPRPRSPVSGSSDLIQLRYYNPSRPYIPDRLWAVLGSCHQLPIDEQLASLLARTPPHDFHLHIVTGLLHRYGIAR